MESMKVLLESVHFKHANSLLVLYIQTRRQNIGRDID